MNLRVYKNVMSANEQWAAKTRSLLSEKRACLWNLIGSPGCGKTALLEKLIPRVLRHRTCFVLEGDVETARDAERLMKLDIPAAQIVTHGACHLGAESVHRALVDIRDLAGGMVIVENVGNLVCPAEFDIGETGKIAVLSVTEGEDKPLKYPLLFREAKASVVTKTDLLPHLNARLDQYLENINAVNAALPVFPCSAHDGSGLEELERWLTVEKPH